VYSEDTVCGLVERTKLAASAVLTDRELLIGKQQALLSELEKQLSDVQTKGHVDSGMQVTVALSLSSPLLDEMH
jgi:hypothetical protein